MKLDIEKLERILKINDKNLESELSRQPSLLFWLGSLVADIEAVIAKKEERLSNIEASKAVTIRRKYLEDDKKLTEKSLSELISVSAKVKEFKLSLIEIKRSYKILKGAFTALISKGSMLEQISFNRRKEIDFNIRNQAQKERNLEKTIRRK